jgi:hypothetical protein
MKKKLNYRAADLVEVYNFRVKLFFNPNSYEIR